MFVVSTCAVFKVAELYASEDAWSNEVCGGDNTGGFCTTWLVSTGTGARVVGGVSSSMVYSSIILKDAVFGLGTGLGASDPNAGDQNVTDRGTPVSHCKLLVGLSILLVQSFLQLTTSCFC